MLFRRKPATTIGALRSDLHALREDVGDLADQLTKLMTDKGDEAFKEAKSTVDRIRHNVDGALSDATARSRAAVQSAQDSLNDWTDTLEDTVRERPLTMLAIAVGVGLVVGSSLRR